MRRRSTERREGIALVIAVTAIAILSVLLAEMHENTRTGLVVATTQRDRLRAEYMAKSGLNLTRLLVAQERNIRTLAAPLYASMMGRPPPQIPVWNFANAALSPFCNYDRAREEVSTFDIMSAEGLEGLPGTCEVRAVAENAKININDPLSRGDDQARRNLAMQLFGLMGGYQSPNPYDELFARDDADGQLTTRLDVVTSVVDWWDADTTRTAFDPATNETAASGGEDNTYRRLDDPYEVKNAPFDSLEELRLIRGVGDDFWATFVEPRPHDPQSRLLTIYGIASINPNEAEPAVLLARLCTYAPEESLCADPAESQKFISLLSTARRMMPIPFFSRSVDFLNFVEGKGGARDIYPMLKSFLGEESPLLFTPIAIPREQRSEVARAFVTSASIVTIQSTGRVGRAEVRLSATVTFAPRWTPPPPNAGRMTGLGVLQHYRVD